MDHFVDLLCLLMLDPQRVYAGFDIIATDYKYALQLAFAFDAMQKKRQSLH